MPMKSDSTGRFAGALYIAVMGMFRPMRKTFAIN